MPLQTKTIHFSNEIQRLEQERESLAEQVASLDDDNPELERLAREGQSLDTYLQGLRWACRAHEDENVDVWEASTEAVTLAGLTGGEFGRLEDDLGSSGGTPGSGATRVEMVAEGTVDAPYVSDEMSSRERVSAASQLPLAYQKWVEHRVNELSTVGDETGKSFGELVAAKQADTTSAEESSETT